MFTFKQYITPKGLLTLIIDDKAPVSESLREMLKKHYTVVKDIILQESYVRISE